MRQPNITLGQSGENQAIHYLISHRYLIQDRNVLFPSGEIDIIALDSATQELAFIEVKTRTHTHFGHPSQALNWKKLRSVQSAAMLYLQNRPSLYPFRYDLIVVTPDQVLHYKNITL